MLQNVISKCFTLPEMNSESERTGKLYYRVLRNNLFRRSIIKYDKFKYHKINIIAVNLAYFLIEVSVLPQKCKVPEEGS
jgi:hypothetical protein